MNSQLILDFQILFDMEPLDERGKIDQHVIYSSTPVGPIKNLIGKTSLHPKRVYSFSFRIINAFTSLIGVVDESGLEQLKESQGNKPFSSMKKGFALFSNGTTREGQAMQTSSSKKISE